MSAIYVVAASCRNEPEAEITRHVNCSQRTVAKGIPKQGKECAPTSLSRCLPPHVSGDEARVRPCRNPAAICVYPLQRKLPVSLPARAVVCFHVTDD